MDYLKTIDGILRNLQEVTMVAAYGNVSKMKAAMDGLIELSQALQNVQTESKEEAVNA